MIIGSRFVQCPLVDPRDCLAFRLRKIPRNRRKIDKHRSWIDGKLQRDYSRISAKRTVGGQVFQMNNVFYRSMIVLVLAGWGGIGCASVSFHVNQNSQEVKLEGAHAVYIEPILENAELELRSQASGDMTVYYQDKPFFAQPNVRRKMHEQVVDKLKEHGVTVVHPIPEQPVLVVRTTIVEQKEIDSNRVFQILACMLGAGFLCPPLWIYNLAVPVRTELAIRAVVQFFEIPASEVAQRQILSPGSLFPVFNTQGLQPLAQRQLDTEAVDEHGLVDGWLNSKSYEDTYIEVYSNYLAVELSAAIASMNTGRQSPAEEAEPSNHSF